VTSRRGGGGLGDSLRGRFERVRKISLAVDGPRILGEFAPIIDHTLDEVTDVLV